MTMSSFPQKLAEVNDPQDLLRLTLEHFQADTGTIHVLEADGLLHLRALAGLVPPPVLEAIRVIPIGKGIAGRAVELGQPVNICNLQTDSEGIAPPGARTTGVQGSMCVPMIVDGKAVGALGVGTYRPRTFTETDIALLLETGREIARKLWSP